MDLSLYWWTAFNAFILTMVALDIGISHRQARVVTLTGTLFQGGFLIILPITSSTSKTLLYPSNALHCLTDGISTLLIYVAIIMGISDLVKIPITLSRCYIFISLSLAMLASVLFKMNDPKPSGTGPDASKTQTQ